LGAGIHGQALFVDQTTDTVIVKFSSQPTMEILEMHMAGIAAMEAIAKNWLIEISATASGKRPPAAICSRYRSILFWCKFPSRTGIEEDCLADVSLFPRGEHHRVMLVQIDEVTGMDGIHDLGGMQGFGRVEREIDEPVFHENWQETTFCLMVAAQMVLQNHSADEYRHSVERMEPIHYLSSHYYERMLTGTITLLVEKGVFEIDDLEERAGGKIPMARPVAEHPMADLQPQPDARFKVGDRVRVMELHPRGHARAPGFCRGKEGTVLHVAPRFNFPDTSAHGGKLREEHTYHVEFDARDLWFDSDSENDSVIVDLWDSYLERAEA